MRCVNASRPTTAAGPLAVTAGWRAPRCSLPAPTTRLGDKSEGQTCHVECGNCPLRQRLGRFVRKTLSFSKCERLHALALRLFVHQYNQQPVI